MHPLVLLAAAGLIAALIWRRRKRKFGGGTGSMPSKLDVCIVLGGDAANPRVETCPDEIDAMWGEQIRWTIKDPNGTGARVWLTGFRPKGSSTKKDPLVGPDQDRKNTKDPKVIRDTVKRGADAGKYEYEVWLNDKLTADPDIIIREAP